MNTASEQLQILIIEDDEILRQSLSERLALEGFRILEAPDGKEGLRLALAFRPDVILCDVMMPIVDGYQVLEELRMRKETAEIPLIFLSARIDRLDVRRGMSLGADDYLCKPVAFEELLASVLSQLARRAWRQVTGPTGERVGGKPEVQSACGDEGCRCHESDAERLQEVLTYCGLLLEGVSKSEALGGEASPCGSALEVVERESMQRAFLFGRSEDMIVRGDNTGTFMPCDRLRMLTARLVEEALVNAESGTGILVELQGGGGCGSLGVTYSPVNSSQEIASTPEALVRLLARRSCVDFRLGTAHVIASLYGGQLEVVEHAGGRRTLKATFSSKKNLPAAYEAIAHH